MLDKDYPYVELTSSEAHTLDDDRCCRCPVCSKVFYIAETRDWVYKTLNNKKKVRFLCSYSCYNKAKQLVTPLRTYRKQYTYVEGDYEY